MPRQVLNRPEHEVFAGFFGKLPTTGDFVARGLPDAFRRNWDGWITRHVAPWQRRGTGWPEGGLRFRLASGGRVAAGLILPGEDSAGRLFPLSLMLIGPDLPGPEALDPWCDAAMRLAVAEHDPDDLWDALESLNPPAGSTQRAEPFVLWAKTLAPQPADAADPSAVLAALFAPVSSG